MEGIGSGVLSFFGISSDLLTGRLSLGDQYDRLDRSLDFIFGLMPRILAIGGYHVKIKGCPHPDCLDSCLKGGKCFG